MKILLLASLIGLSGCEFNEFASLYGLNIPQNGQQFNPLVEPKGVFDTAEGRKKRENAEREARRWRMENDGYLPGDKGRQQRIKDMENFQQFDRQHCETC